MAEIIVLKKWREQHPGRAPARLPQNKSAELMLFTGVRYERHDGFAREAMVMEPIRAEQN